MKISKACLDLIKSFEGCSLKAYRCPANVLTIGYGHTANVKEGQVITKEQAEELLIKDLARFEKGVLAAVKVPLTQHQFDALVSFSFNCDLGALQRSDLLKCVNKKDFAGAANEFGRWVRAGGKVLKGLVRRRQAEMALFSTHVSSKVEKHSHPKQSEAKQSKIIYLPKTSDSWRVYPLNKAPVKGNEVGYLNPKKFNGLQYEILGETQKDTYIIKTANFGKVQIYAGPDTGAVIK